MKNTELEAIIEKYDLVGKSYADVCVILPNKSWGDILLIMGYINQHYAIKPDVMRELKKDENVRRILEGVKEVKVGWKKNKNFQKFFGWWDGSKYLLGYDSKGTWCDDLSSVLFFEDDVDATPEEIKQMLIKKLEADGLKVGCKYICTYDKKEATFKSYDSLEYIEFSDGTDGLTDSNGGYIYYNGQFAKIIQPELTIEQRLERLEKHLKID